MSVNITVNGKFAKHSRANSLLDDPQKVKKAEEQERRKVRLLQVREESKKLAKKIRDEVNEEKRRELQKLQAIKEQELECWRQHALDRKGEEYRSAIFQMGTAHNAARLENAHKAGRQGHQNTYKSFKKQMETRKLNQCNNQFRQGPCCPCHQTPQCSIKQFKCTCVPKANLCSRQTEEHHKRKRHSSISSSDTEYEDESCKEKNNVQQSCLSVSSTADTTTSSTLSEQNKATQTSMTNTQTPAVCVDVEVDSEDSVVISAPVDVQDKHAKYNKQFCSFIRVCPRRGRKRHESTNENPSIQQSITATQSSDITILPSEKPQHISPTKDTTAFKPTTKEKHFTLISEIVQKQQQQQQVVTYKPGKNQNINIPPPPPVSRANSSTATPHMSPRKQVTQTALLPASPRKSSTVSSGKQTALVPAARQLTSPRRSSAFSRTSKTFTSSNKPTSATKKLHTNTAIQTSATITNSYLGRVQFFDYKTKTYQERDQADANVNVQKQKDDTQLTAMEQAALENERERVRQSVALRQSQRMEERSQKALEREQIRRDCNELTEKLDALTKEYPNQGPILENQQHIFVDKQLRKEAKMNSAVEKLLNRPAIITCSEINRPTERDTMPTVNAATNTVSANEINVGAVNQHLQTADDVSSDSCCSILLGYVDDQSKLVQQDLQDPSNTGSNQDVNKQKRLKSLLKRLDELRNSLVQELKNESECKRQNQSKFSSNEENLRQVLDSIGEMRKEREQILGKEQSKPVKDREKLLEAQEALLEKKIKEFYELQKKQGRQTFKKKDIKSNKYESEESSSHTNNTNEGQDSSSNDKENITCVTKEKPVEILITVRGDCKRNPKRRIASKKSPCKLATLIRSPHPKIAMTKKHTPKKKTHPVSLQEKAALRRQNSYDSNSTSYMSLPSQMPTQIDDLAKRISKENETQNTPSTTTTSEKNENQPQAQNGSESYISQANLQGVQFLKTTSSINPLIAQYIQRLLGMSHSAIKKLAVSSSDIETPPSSVINTPTNISNSDLLISSERLIEIHNFIEENKSFIKDLEKSISTQNSVSLENSMRMFDDLWRKRLKVHSKENIINKEKERDTVKSKSKRETKKNLKFKETTKSSTASEKQSPKHTEKQKAITVSSEQLTLRFGADQLPKNLETNEKESSKSVESKKQTIEKADKAIDTNISNNTLTDSQLTRYAKLTENCTHRIAELTELINRVRKEKQRLLEVTLSSVSENGRNSTEYHDIPEAKSSTRIEQQEDQTGVSSISSEGTTHNKQLYNSTDTAPEVAKLTSADKNKQIAASHDSGIAESRPLTALENHNETEPVPQTCSFANKIPCLVQCIKKMKPPPTLKRFSPQLPEEEELPHELSTIFEVDTPATSRVNTMDVRKIPVEGGTDQLQERINYPTFEQYIKQLNLDITQLTPEQRNELQEEFNLLLKCFQSCLSPKDTSPTSGKDTAVARNTADKSENRQLQEPMEFPTFEQYIKQLNLDITQLDPEQSYELQQEFISLLECFQKCFSPKGRLKYKEFPSVKTYLEKSTETIHFSETLQESAVPLTHLRNIPAQNFPSVREYLKHNASKGTTDEQQQLLDTESLENVTEEGTKPNTDDETVSIDIEEEMKKRKILKNSFRYVKEKKKILSSTAKKDVAFYDEILAAESGIDKLSSSSSGNTAERLEVDIKKITEHLRGQKNKQQTQKFQFLSSTTNSTNTTSMANSATQAVFMEEGSNDNSGKALNLRDFLTRELLKRANNSGSTISSSTSDDSSLRNHFLYSIIESMTPRTPAANSKSGGQTLERQKTSTPVPQQSSQTTNSPDPNRANNTNNSPGQLFSGESRISSVRCQHDRSVHFSTSDSGNDDRSHQ